MSRAEAGLGAAAPQMARRSCSTVMANDGDGRWLVRGSDRSGELAFASRRAAIRFAVFGTWQRPGSGAALLIPASATKA